MDLPRTFFASDLHFGDERILLYEQESGKKCRDFRSLSDMENTIINNYNSTVDDRDTCFFLGDIAKSQEGLELVQEMNGTKILICGNWEMYKAKNYLKYFQDVRGAQIFPREKLICTHYPIHPDCLMGDWKAVHGHTHHQSIKDNRYFSVCPEVNNYFPVALDYIVDTFERK